MKPFGEHIFERGAMLRWSTVALTIVLALALAVPAVADDRVDHDIPDDGEPDTESDRPTLEGAEDPVELDRSQLIDSREFEGIQLADEAIVRLRDLIDGTSPDDPARAEYLYNLAEKYWARSRYYDNSAIEQQDECFILEDEGDEQGARRCRFRVEDMEEEAIRLREESQDLYVEIIRNYPNFEELDTIYFQLGSNLMDLEEEEEALGLFERLLANFPQTRYLPEVLLYFADYYFQEGDMDAALEAYQRVVEFPDSPVYQYARYKMGWTYFNLDNYEQALEEFLTVVDLATAADEGTAARSMLNQVRNDIVRVYARIGAPDRAIAFFQDIAPERENWLALSERLAVYYGDEAAFADSTEMYNNLIDINRDSYKVLDYQYEVMRNTTTIDSYSEDSIRELGRMLQFVQLAEDGQFTEDEEVYPELYEKIEASSRNWANTYYREARRTQNQSLFVMAHHLYGWYLDTYPDSEDRYDMTFFHAQLLYDLEQWDQAAASYERVLEIDPNGEYTEDAVLMTMLALFNEVETDEDRAEIVVNLDPDDEDEIPEIPEPLEMPELEQRLLRATANYIEYVPDGERIVDVKYTRARTYYDFQHLEEAAEIFEDIAFNHSEHRLAEISANLHLHALNLLQDYEGLRVAVAAYVDQSPIDDPEFQADLYEINLAIRYNICVVLDEEEEWEEAAHCYLQYVREFPRSEQAASSLYNAALDFERIHEIGMAIQVRQNLLELFPDSELAPETLFNLGGNYHAWAIYGEASRYYELFVQNFPDEDDAEDALSNAATFRHGLGEHERAIANYERYLELFGDDNPERAADVFFQIAQIYEEQDLEQDAYQQYRDYIRRYADQGTPDRLLESHVKIGLHYWNGGDRERGLSEFERTLDVYGSFSEEEQQAMGDGRDAAAQAMFMRGEELFEVAEAIRIDSTDDEELQEVTREKLEAANEAREIYEEVIVFGRPDWAIAALYRMGSGFQDFAETLRDSPVPDQLTAGQQEQYRGLLEDQAMLFEDQAVELYQHALYTARDANWFNEFSQQAETELAQLRPADYRQPSELRAQPIYLKDRFMGSPFIKDVEDDDLLQQLEEGELAGDDAGDLDDDEQASGESSTPGGSSS